LYANTNGLQLRYLNPAEFLLFDANNQPEDIVVNLMLDAQVWLQLGPVHIRGEGLLDDFDITV